MVNSSTIALFPYSVTVNVLSTADISSIQGGYKLSDDLKGL
jgi:hypothetical protein